MRGLLVLLVAGLAGCGGSSAALDCTRHCTTDADCHRGNEVCKRGNCVAPGVDADRCPDNSATNTAAGSSTTGGSGSTSASGSGSTSASSATTGGSTSGTSSSTTSSSTGGPGTFVVEGGLGVLDASKRQGNGLRLVESSIATQFPAQCNASFCIEGGITP